MLIVGGGVGYVTAASPATHGKQCSNFSLLLGLARCGVYRCERQAAMRDVECRWSE